MGLSRRNCLAELSLLLMPSSSFALFARTGAVPANLPEGAKRVGGKLPAGGLRKGLTAPSLCGEEEDEPRLMVVRVRGVRIFVISLSSVDIPPAPPNTDGRLVTGGRELGEACGVLPVDARTRNFSASSS